MAPFFRRLRARIKYWNNAEELKKELDLHRVLAAAAFAADGTSERESRWKAARLLGNTTIAREDARAVWIARWIEQLMQDVRYTFRTMRREWAFAITASVTLALGIGVLAGVFTVFNAIFLRPWPVRDAEQVFGISAALVNPQPESTGPGRRVSYAVWDQIRGGMTTADLSVKYDYLDTLRPAATGRGRSGRFALVDETFLQVVGIEMQLGARPAAGGQPEIAITNDVWLNQFGSDPAVVGRTIWLGARPVTISGVLEKRFVGFTPQSYEGVMLLSQTHTWLNKGLSNVPDLLTNPQRCCVEVLGRLRTLFTRAQAGQEIEARVNSAHAELNLPTLRIIPWDTAMASRPSGIKRSVPTLFALLFTGCGIVTLLACANIGNLQLARGLRRSREVSVRLSLGASRRRIVKQFLTESAVLAVIGAAGGLVIAWTVPAAILSMEKGTTLLAEPDASVVAFAILIGGVGTLLFGLAPALRVTKIEWRGAAAGLAPGAGRLRGLLLGLQIALSLSLIASASLLSRGALRAAGGADAGFEFENINSFSVIIPSDKFESTKTAQKQLTASLLADPQWALLDDTPWRGHMPTSRVWVRGLPNSVMAQPVVANQAAVSLLRLPLVDGRWPADDARLKEAAISRSLARSLWSREDVIGRTFATTHPFTGAADYTVVGLMDEVRMQDTVAKPAFVTALRADSLPVIVGSPSLEAKVKMLFGQADASFRVMSRSLVSGLRNTMESTFVGISIASGLSLVALLLASFGVFGVFAYIVEERKREIGVRLALGANRAQVRRSIFAATRWPVVGGLAAGLVLAMVGGFILRSNLYGLSVLDPLSYLMVAAILAFAAMAATFIPLRRALRVDPAVTLRQD